MAAWSAVAAGLFASAAASAAELTYGVDVGVGHSDNITRVSENEQDETIATVGGQLGLDHDSRKLRANVATRFEYLDYLDDTYDGELVGSLVGNATLDIVEERFSWALTDTFGQVTQNQFAASTPDNRENVNYLSTGPDLTLSLGSRNKLLLNGRYSDVHYETSALGNQRVSAALAVRRDLSDATNVSVNVTTEQVSYDTAAETADYDNHEGFLNYSLDAARTNLSIDAGATEIETDDQKNSSWLGRISLTRRASPALTVGLELGHDFSDAGNSFVDQQATQPGSVEPLPVQQTAMPFENAYVTAFGRFSRNRTGLQLRVGYYDESYDALPLFDRKRITLNLSVDRDLTSALNAHVGANYSQQKYESLDLEFRDLIATFGVRWKLGRLVMMNIDYEYLKRSDDSGGSGYRANEVWLRFGYLIGEGAAGGAGL
ncbi:MAG: outer membrane beta-barrel protein [Pseudomonadota bacterium]